MLRLARGLDKWLIDGWRSQAPRLWSIRIALFWGALSGLYCAWPAFAEALPLPVFAGLSVAMSAAIAVARLTKQPGLYDG
jgi:hypothetical protein